MQNMELDNDQRSGNSNEQRIIAGTNAVEDITERLDLMNVEYRSQEAPLSETNMVQYEGSGSKQINSSNPLPFVVPEARPTSQHQHQQDQSDPDNTNHFHHQHLRQQQSDDTILMEDEDNSNSNSNSNNNNNNNSNNHVVDTNHEQAQANYSSSNILIVTNVDLSVFDDKSVQSIFEALFLAYDPAVTFRYLKSFRRVRLDFTSVRGAEMARANLSHYKLGNTEFKCYSAQIIRPNNNIAQLNAADSRHLNIPKLTKQFLISPPASPPVGWEPVTENSPCIDVQLISAIANLVPGKVHEIHPGNESQPGIYVEVCEDVRYDSSMKSCSRIPRTMSPGCCQ